ncbi:ADP-ribosyltransferase, partial [Streptomyces sp. NPDC042319]|uniref:ADP-ribosyltransferase n=1 Tax=Streptomyces sp. NPDC042319 TaxID=3154332 RepID=UPI0033ED8F9B
GAGKAGAVAKALSVAGKAGKVIDPMTYVAKGAGASLSKIGDIAKSIKGIGKVDLPTMPDGSLHLPDGQLPQTGGHLPAANGIPTSPSVPHQTVPGTGLPQSWTIDQPAAAASHTGNGFPGVTHANDTYPMGGHNNTPVNAAGHTPAGSYGPPPSGSYGPPPSGSFGPPPSGSYGPPSGGDFGPHGGGPYGPHGGPYSPHGGSFGPTGGSFDQVPGNAGNHVPTPHIDPAGHVPTGAVPDHAPTGGQHVPTGGQHVPTGGQHVPGAAGHPGTPNAWYHQTPTNSVTHDVPTTPHPGGHDVPGTGGHGTPDAPHHGPGHDGPGAHDGHGGHGHDGAHGGGHADDAAHAGDDADFGDGGAHHGADTPAAPGHGGTDVPGSGAGEPFEYKPHMSADDFDNLPTAAEKHAVAMEELAGGTNRAPSASNAAGLKYGNAYWNDFLDSLSPESRQALKTYSGNEYDLINSHLRFGDKLDDSLKRTIEEMDKVMGARPVPEDVMIVRGTGVDHIKIDGRPLKSPAEMEGGVFDDKAFTSTALGKTPPPPFDLKPVHMHLRVPKDTPALWIDHLSSFPGERELLLAKGSEYKVTRVFMDETDGKWHVYGEVLPRPHS